MKKALAIVGAAILASLLDWIIAIIANYSTPWIMNLSWIWVIILLLIGSGLLLFLISPIISMLTIPVISCVKITRHAAWIPALLFIANAIAICIMPWKGEGSYGVKEIILALFVTCFWGTIYASMVKTLFSIEHD